jgi:hypothetical protein
MSRSPFIGRAIEKYILQQMTTVANLMPLARKWNRKWNIKKCNIAVL